jgi:predicted outer membrane repeat protein
LALSFDRRPILEWRNIMGLSSWLRKWQRSAPSSRTRGRAGKRLSCPPRLEALEDRWLPSTLTVTSLADSGPGTLRAAILAADAGSPSDKFTIGFTVTGTINLQTELSDLNNSIAIQGPGASSLTVEQAPGTSWPFNNWPIFNAETYHQISVSGLTMANSVAGIVNGAPMAVTNCVFLNNHTAAGYGGGGIYNLYQGTLTVTGSAFSGNSAEAGGGIYVLGGTVTLSDSIISGNFAAAGGGIFVSGGTVTITTSTISGNYLTSDPAFIFNGQGGGIFNGGTLTVRGGTTFSGNSATYGGAIYNQGGASATIRDSAFTTNSAAEGGAVYNDASSTLEVQNSSFSTNTASDSGGGLYNLGTATLQQCGLSKNAAGSDGGGIFDGPSGMLAVKDSTLLSNSAPSGADLFYLGALTLDDSTVGVIGP